MNDIDEELRELRQFKEDIMRVVDSWRGSVGFAQYFVNQRPAEGQVVEFRGGKFPDWTGATYEDGLLWLSDGRSLPIRDTSMMWRAVAAIPGQLFTKEQPELGALIRVDNNDGSAPFPAVYHGEGYVLRSGVQIGTNPGARWWRDGIKFGAHEPEAGALIEIDGGRRGRHNWGVLQMIDGQKWAIASACRWRAAE